MVRGRRGHARVRARDEIEQRANPGGPRVVADEGVDGRRVEERAAGPAHVPDEGVGVGREQDAGDALERIEARGATTGRRIASDS